MRRTVLALAFLLASPALARAPKLTLFISVDAMGSDVLMRNRPYLKSGLARSMDQGAFFPDVRYEYVEIVTAAGHATLATGANPSRHGVNSNQILNRETGRQEAVFADADHPVLEVPPATEDASPKNLMAETLADRLRLATRMKGKAISVSGKPRSAIPMAGRLGTAWWFHPAVGKFVTGTWYAKEFPSWVKAFNDKRPADALFGKTWSLALPQSAYPGEDDRPFESDRLGLGRKFPHPVTGGLGAPGPEFYKALGATPFMTDLIVQMAKAAIEGEQLGRDDAADALFVGFSPVDYAYHSYGPYSWEMQDMMVRLDQAIGDLIAAAERAAGKGNVLVVITADHGGAGVAEEWTAAGLDAARVDIATLQKGLNAALKKQFGVEPVVLIEEVDVYLDEKMLAQKKLESAQVRRAAAAWLRAHPSVALAVPRDELNALVDPGSWSASLRNGYFPGRSGDVLIIMRAHHVLTDYPTGTSHGTPYSYDAQVPLVLWGPGIKPGRYRAQVSATQVAPTVASLWETIAPALSEGAPLSEALR